jgi:hypothetical protein
MAVNYPNYAALKENSNSNYHFGNYYYQNGNY